MANKKDDMNHGKARTRLTEDDATRVAYVASTPLEGGFIAESEPVDMFSAAHNIEKAQAQAQAQGGSAQPQLNRDDDEETDQGGAGKNPNSSSRRLPKKQ